MKGRFIDYSIGRNRKNRITLEIDGNISELFDQLKDQELEITIKKYRQKRSLDENAMFHALVGEIAMVQGLSNDEVKQRLVIDYGTLARDEANNIIGFKLPPSCDVFSIYPYVKLHKQVEENGKPFNCYLVYKRSSEMDSKEMAHLIEGAIQEAKELGIDTDQPSDIKYS